jgi:tetrapyrrole methylase family protein/MazG family protein
MAQVAKSLPALIYAQKIQSIAAKAGFDFSGANKRSQKKEETDELEEVLSSVTGTRFQKRAAIYCLLSRMFSVSPGASEESLYLSSEKFLHRFTALEGLIRADGLEMSAMSAEKLDYYWNLCKKT